MKTLSERMQDYYGTRRRRRQSELSWIWVTIGWLPFCVLMAMLGLAWLSYERDIGGHLKRAADANTIGLAKQELEYALAGMKIRGCTSGQSQLLIYTPKCDVKFWHDNIQSAYDELEHFPTDAKPLEISNQLMKLRETLIDEGQSPSVTAPPRISLFPNQFTFALSILGAGLLGVVITAGYLKRYS